MFLWRPWRSFWSGAYWRGKPILFVERRDRDLSCTQWRSVCLNGSLICNCSTSKHCVIIFQHKYWNRLSAEVLQHVILCPYLLCSRFIDECNINQKIAFLWVISRISKAGTYVVIVIQLAAHTEIAMCTHSWNGICRARSKSIWRWWNGSTEMEGTFGRLSRLRIGTCAYVVVCQGRIMKLPSHEYRTQGMFSIVIMVDSESYPLWNCNLAASIGV